MQLPGTPPNRSDVALLKGSFLSEEIIKQALIRRVTSIDGRELVGRKDRANYAGLIFPYVWPGETAVREYRLRRDKPELEQNGDGELKEINKYMSPPGRGSLLYFVPGTPLSYLNDISLPAIITEGEKKTIGLYRLAHIDRDPGKPRFLPMGLSGVWNWRGVVGKTEGPDGDRQDIKGTIRDFDRVPFDGRVVYIVFDVDVLNNQSVRAARTRLALELQSRRAIVKFVNLPRIEKLKGVDDFLYHQGQEFVLNLINASATTVIKPPDGFRVSDSGVYAVDPTGEKDDTWICSPLHITASTRNHNSEDWGQLLEFRDRDGNRHQWLMPMSMLAGDGTEYRERLLSMGLQISPGPKAKTLLNIYIQTANPPDRVRCVSKPGWHHDAYVLPDETIGDVNGEKTLLQSDARHLIATSGTLEQWRENVSLYCVGNSRLVFAVSAAFASALLYMANEQGGGFNFRGHSSRGKSSALLTAGSVWGGGGVLGYCDTWRTTANGLEAIAEMHNDGLLCLDEMGECADRDVGDIAYMLANGSGKARMTRAVASRKKIEWRLMLLSSSEKSMAHMLETAGIKVRAGQEVRLLDLDAIAGDFGLFENLHHFKLGSEFADHLSRNARRYYGTPIRAFITKMIDNRQKTETYIKSQRDWFIKNFVPADSAGEVYRAAARFSLVGAAGELASNITGWPKNESAAAAVTLFKGWLANRGSVGSSEMENAIRQVRGFIESHGSSRFQNMTSWDGRPVINRAGFRRLTDDESGSDSDYDYLILSEVFRREICSGYDHKAVAEELSKRGMLKRSASPQNRHYTIELRVPELGKTRLYCLTPTLFSES